MDKELVNAQVQALYDEADRILIEAITKEAQRIVNSKSNNLTRFEMGMGIWSFCNENGNEDHFDYYKRDMKCMVNIRELIEDWNEIFKITGTPISIKLKR